MMRWFTTLWPCLLVIVPTQSAHAHPGHYSTAEIEWNSKSNRFEVAMRLRIPDLEDAISRMRGSRFRIESSPNAEKLLQQYLQQHVSIGFDGHATSRLHWVGMELEIHDLWIYFEAESVPAADSGSPTDEMPVTGTTAGNNDSAVESITLTEKDWAAFLRGNLSRQAPATGRTPDEKIVRIRNTALMDVQSEQTNIVTLRYGSTAQAMTLTGRQSKGHFRILRQR